MALSVTFWLLLYVVLICMRAACRALSGMLTSALRRHGEALSDSSRDFPSGTAKPCQIPAPAPDQGGPPCHPSYPVHPIGARRRSAPSTSSSTCVGAKWEHLCNVAHFRILVDLVFSACEANVTCVWCARALLGLTGLIVWAYSTPRFSVCDRDSRGYRILNATLLPVAFLLPLCGADRGEVVRISWRISAWKLAGWRVLAAGSSRKAEETLRDRHTARFFAENCNEFCSARGRGCAGFLEDFSVEARGLTCSRRGKLAVIINGKRPQPRPAVLVEEEEPTSPAQSPHALIGNIRDHSSTRTPPHRMRFSD
ncbi:hypothetical protein Taro_043898 [Colocasia esculenta]|uniref:Uncharacterized protein n=1 Tax=Colocasia esculenta TaxID=4460 RepID=A0A843WHM4_COLES|nr:hypothetical protein [Colocasia esculenta]